MSSSSSSSFSTYKVQRECKKWSLISCCPDRAVKCHVTWRCCGVMEGGEVLEQGGVRAQEPDCCGDNGGSPPLCLAGWTAQSASSSLSSHVLIYNLSALWSTILSDFSIWVNVSREYRSQRSTLSLWPMIHLPSPECHYSLSVVNVLILISERPSSTSLVFCGLPGL